MAKTFTVSEIREKLLTDDRWLARALVALNDRQTSDEQRDEVTRYHNEQGFRPMHAKRGTSMAQFYLRTASSLPGSWHGGGHAPSAARPELKSTQGS